MFTGFFPFKNMEKIKDKKIGIPGLNEKAKKLYSLVPSIFLLPLLNNKYLIASDFVSKLLNSN